MNERSFWSNRIRPTDGATASFQNVSAVSEQTWNSFVAHFEELKYTVCIWLQLHPTLNPLFDYS